MGRQHSRRLTIALVFLLLWQVGYPAAPVAAEPAAAPDLMVEVTVTPALPALNEPVTIAVTVRNQGTVSTGGQVLAELYVDPATVPPAGDGFPIVNVPSLSAGGFATGNRQHTFVTQGCDHLVYVVVDRANTIAESDEGNNDVQVPVCVGVACEPDLFEADNACSEAKWTAPGLAQDRTFCHLTDEIQEDTDWVKFTAFAGAEYTLAAAKVGLHADPQVAVFDHCDGTLLTGPVASAVWTPAASGVYVARMTQKAGATGPLTGYTLNLSVATGVTDDYEPDNNCATAREIATDGSGQEHRFQAPNDEDWLKFAVNAGESFTVLTDNPGPGVAPVVSLLTDCSQAASGSAAVQTAAQATADAATDQVYYARLANQDPAVFGADKSYRVRVAASACSGDGQEEDDTSGQAVAATVDAAGQSHTVCPPGDEDWVKFDATAGQIYVVQTANLGPAADTTLQLFGLDGSSLLAQNDDYGYVKASRIVWQAPAAGTYFAQVRHVNPVASGADTHYDLTVQKGFCAPDAQEGQSGDNGPGDAATLAAGPVQNHNFCADPLRTDLGDQDWVAVNAVAGGTYQVQTTGLGPNSDTVLALYDRNGRTLLQTSDDVGTGLSTRLAFTPTVAGAYLVRVTHYNSNINGAETNYQVQLTAQEPTPTPTPTPTPPPAPTPTPTPDPAGVKTLIVVNRERLEALYGAGESAALMDKLFALANHATVAGAVLQVENDAGAASAYAAWTADAASLQDNTKANGAAAAVRGQIMNFVATATNVQHVVLVGDDRVIPFRRVADEVTPLPGMGSSSGVLEESYAVSVTAGSSVAAVLAANMVLTDNYYGDREPGTWQDKQQNVYELFVPDLAVGRLVETPAEMRAFIDQYLADQKLETGKVLVTGYDFVQDSAETIATFFENDELTTDDELIAPFWPGAALRSRQLAATPRFDLQSINGHSTHVAALTPDKDNIQASEIAAASADLAGAVVFSVGCHGGVNDAGALDLTQAFMQRRAHYVGNTGYGWGSAGVAYTEALMRNFVRELVRDAQAEIGPALAAAKKKYVSQNKNFDAFDAKVVMQLTLYGLPMYAVTSGATLGEGDPFPSAEQTITPPTAFGAMRTGSLTVGLPGSFGAFGETTTGTGTSFDLDGNVELSAGDPVLPLYFADVTALTAGSLRGAVFLGGEYTEQAGVDPVIALPFNEYVQITGEPTFGADSWYPALPFTANGAASAADGPDTLLVSLGQFNSNSGAMRLFDQMAFDTFYSASTDQAPATVLFVDAVLDPAVGVAQVKVEATDPAGVQRVVVAYTAGAGKWESKDLVFDPAAQKWTGVFTATSNSLCFVQVVDGAGNVVADDNKGRYYQPLPPLPLAMGQELSRRLFLPAMTR